MIGGALIRFFFRTKEATDRMGRGFSSTWKDIKTRAPTVLRDVLTETAMEGLKGFNTGGKGKKPNWKAGLQGVKRGASRSVKRKVEQELRRLVTTKVRKDLFGV